MGINLAIWFSVGMASGLLVYLFFDREKKYLLGTLLSGVVGAFVGGITYFAIKIGAIAVSLSSASVLWSIIGSLGLLGLITILVKSENQKIISKN